MPTIGDMLKQDYNYVFLFGKHKYDPIYEVLVDDPGYILWAADNIDSFNPTDEILDEATYLSNRRK